VLCLQEVDRNQARSGGAHQTEAIAAAMGAADWRFEPALIGEPGAQWEAAGSDDDDGTSPAYGVGLVSRHPVERWHAIRLAPAPFRSPVYIPTVKRFILLHDEPRVALVAQIVTRRGPLIVAGAHLSFVPGWNLWQLRQLVRRLVALGHPTVLVGDLNLPRLPVRLGTSGWRMLAKDKTFPAPSPKFQIDHALGFGDIPPVIVATARQLPVSDHRALVVELAE
jgi:endonuclease/exonuclease/phosphatase family metal-dependent hydrolase